MMNHETAWAWYISNAAGFLFAINIIAAALLSHNLNRRFLLPLAFGVHSALLCISAIILNVLGNHRQSFGVWTYALGQFAFFIVVLTDSRSFVKFCLCCGVYYCVAFAIEAGVIYNSFLSPRQIASGLPYLGIIQVIAALSLMINERILWTRIIAENTKVIEIHNEAWRQIICKEEHMEALQELKKVCRRVRGAVGQAKTYQSVPNMQSGPNNAQLLAVSPANKHMTGEGSFDSDANATSTPLSASQEGPDGILMKGFRGTQSAHRIAGPLLPPRSSSEPTSAPSNHNGNAAHDKYSDSASPSAQDHARTKSLSNGGHHPDQPHRDRVRSTEDQRPSFESAFPGLTSGDRNNQVSIPISEVIAPFKPGIDSRYRLKARSLDQLFAQAAGVHKLLITKASAWAFSSNGSFPPSADGKSVERHRHEHGVSEFAKLKSVDRAIEKVQLLYKGDVSRLLDICRQRIVFDSIRDMITCMQTIESDSDIRIVRIKNRMDPSYDAQISAGFRYVHINLCISTEQTRRWCIDKHICELQLVYRDFFLLQVQKYSQAIFEFVCALNGMAIILVCLCCA